MLSPRRLLTAAMAKKVAIMVRNPAKPDIADQRSVLATVSPRWRKRRHATTCPAIKVMAKIPNSKGVI